MSDPCSIATGGHTFAFLLDEIAGTLACSDPDEQLGAFSEVDPEGLLWIAELLEHLPHAYSAHFEES